MAKVAERLGKVYARSLPSTCQEDRYCEERLTAFIQDAVLLGQVWTIGACLQDLKHYATETARNLVEAATDRFSQMKALEDSCGEGALGVYGLFPRGLAERPEGAGLKLRIARADRLKDAIGEEQWKALHRPLLPPA